MRYIYDGTLRNRTIEPPKAFVGSEPVMSARRNSFGKLLYKLRRTEKPLIVGHEQNRWRWTDD
ncbi:hypothetical protein SAMN05421752_11435 [Natronorubrum thiooxidans]|uniref:Uncharacterized protein n=1 Tax=Natronorubrum thiooxidans TaxID=308853 RepID=A0A1N7GPW8_9EURY|nr:hypothetical protein SAMN05421752_11435 [Natronorubrum thiooxidans]